MPDDKPTPKAQADELVPFVVDKIRGLYVPFFGAVVRLIPNTPEALASAQRSLRWSRAAWLN